MVRETVPVRDAPPWPRPVRGLLTRQEIEELRAAGIAVNLDQNPLATLLEAAEARGLACRITRRSRRSQPSLSGDRGYRARVRPIRPRGSPSSGRGLLLGVATQGRGDNCAAALARAVLAWVR